MLEFFVLDSSRIIATWRRLLMTLVLVVASCGMGSTLRAEGVAKIQFDVGNLVGCRDVTPADFAAVNPGERILEARIQVSLLSLTSPGQEIAELLLRIESPERSLQIADYFPKTTLTTDILGPVNIERESEQSNSLEFNVTGQAGASSAHASGNQQGREKYVTKGQQLPPLVLCAASGTVLRGHGVYFKLCPTSRTSLEGAHDMTLQFQVPAAWRADYLLVTCEASGVSTNLLGMNGARVRRGAKSFIVAAYLEGDMVAKSRAAGLIRAERELRMAAAAFQNQLKKNTSPDPLRELSSLFKGIDRRIPENWLEQVLFCATSGSLSFEEKLPTEVRVASLNYRDSKRQVQRINSNLRTPSASNQRVLKPSIQPANYTANDSPQLQRLPPVEY